MVPTVSRVHVATPDGDRALCDAQAGEVLTREEVEASGGRHFTCGACAVLLGACKHVCQPEDTDG